MTKLKSPKLLLGVAGRLAGLSLATLTLLWGPGEARAACTNGDLLDCNPAGQTLNPAARFVDPTPPPGFLQCAGFINTAANDVSDFWENNCIPFKEGELWLRIYDQNNTIVAGARLINVNANCPWAGPTSRGYDTTNQEGEGFLPQPGACNDNSGVSFAWFEGAGNFCGCGLQSCNDIYTANAANTKVLYVGANAGDTNEITFSPPGPKGACSFQNSVTDLKIGIYAPGQVIDTDGDGIPDADDNCPDVPNPNQEDADMDGIGDLCDECPDDIDNDSDGDGICGDVDNCPDIANPGQEDDDGDGIGDACDACPKDPKNDGDGDGVCGAIDNCPDVPNPDQEDSNRNGIGDACEVIDPPDTDSDSTGDDTTTGDGTTGDDTTGGDTTGGDTTGGDTTGGDTTGGNTTGGNTTGGDTTTLPDPTTGVSESGPVPTSGPGNTEPDTLPTADPGTDGSDSSSDGDSDTAGVDDGGCGCTTDDQAPLTSMLLLGLAGLGLRRRRPA